MVQCLALFSAYVRKIMNNEEHGRKRTHRIMPELS